MVDTMTATKSVRTQRALALDNWADNVLTENLIEIDTTALRHIAQIAQRRDDAEIELTEAVEFARRAGRSWSEIGSMLGVSKQAAQRKYRSKSAA